MACFLVPIYCLHTFYEQLENTWHTGSQSKNGHNERSSKKILSKYFWKPFPAWSQCIQTVWLYGEVKNNAIPSPVYNHQHCQGHHLESVQQQQ